MQARQQAVLDEGELVGCMDWLIVCGCVLCQASVIDADGSRRDYYPFGAKPLAPVAVASSSSRVAVASSSSRVASAAVQRQVSKSSPASPPAVLHFVFTTDCTPYQNWQSQLLVHTAKAVGEQAAPRLAVCVWSSRGVALCGAVRWLQGIWRGTTSLRRVAGVGLCDCLCCWFVLD